MNNFKRISAVILAICTAATVFASCGNNNSTTVETSVITEYITEKETVEVEVTDEKGNVSVSVSEKIVTVPVTKTVTLISSEKTKKTKKASSDKKADKTVSTKANDAATQDSAAVSTVKTPGTTQKSDVKATTKKTVVRATVPTTKKPVVDDVINEKAVGLFMLSKTDPVQTGNHATVIIQGTPGKTYSIEFYETPTSKSKIDDAKADANGFVTWTFEITNACNAGKRKVIIKENNSDNYIETSITVK